MDLGELHPSWVQWSLSDDGKIYAPEWRQGLAPGDIRAIPYLHALVAQLRRDLTTTKKALTEMEGLCVSAEHQARFYRRQLILEARLGSMLVRLAD